MPSMMHSGRLVDPAYGVPTIVDIALALSRQVRFGGHGLRWWSVLDHSLFAERLAEREVDPRTRLAVLLHDAHEALTSDVPTAFKTPDLRALQEGLDTRIMDEHFPGGYDVFRLHAADVHVYDRRALLAEAVKVGPPKLGALEPGPFRDLFGAIAAHRGDLDVLDGMLLGGRNGRSAMLAKGTDADNVRDYIAQYEWLTSLLRGE